MVGNEVDVAVAWTRTGAVVRHPFVIQQAGHFPRHRRARLRLMPVGPMRGCMRMLHQETAWRRFHAPSRALRPRCMASGSRGTGEGAAVVIMIVVTRMKALRIDYGLRRFAG